MITNSIEYTNKTNQIIEEKVKPAVFRSVFPVSSETIYDASVAFNKNKDKSLSGDWFAVGGNTEFDAFNSSNESVVQQVIARGVNVSMDYLERMRAQQGNMIGFERKVKSMFDLVEEEQDKIVFNGKYKVPGILSDSHYGTKKGTSTSVAGGLASKTSADIIKVIREAITASKGGGKFVGKKDIIINSANLEILRSSLVNNTDVSVLQWLRKNYPEVGEIHETIAIGNNIVVFEKNPAYLEVKITLPLQEVSPSRENDEGGFSSNYLTTTAGLLVYEPQSIARIVL